MMIFYIATAFVMHHRQEILMAEEYVLPQTMTNLTLKRKEDVYDVFIKALELRESTPHSFEYFIINERIFSSLIDSDELEALLLRIEKLPALPLTMSELLYYCFPGSIQCCNPFCKNGLSIRNDSKYPIVTTTTKRVPHSPLAGSSTASSKRYNDEGKVEPYGSFSSSKTVDRVAGSVKSVVKDTGSRKNLGIISNSLDNSPGKLMMNSGQADSMQNYKPPKRSPPFGQGNDVLHRSASPKRFDFVGKVNDEE